MSMARASSSKIHTRRARIICRCDGADGLVPALLLAAMKAAAAGVLVAVAAETECQLPRKPLWRCGCCGGGAIVVGRSYRARRTSSKLPAHKARMRRTRRTSMWSPRVALLLLLLRCWLAMLVFVFSGGLRDTVLFHVSQV